MSTDVKIDPEASPPPFRAFARTVQPQSALRAEITAAYRRPEPECLPPLLADPVRRLNALHEVCTHR